jgi:hypothetical protein
MPEVGGQEAEVKTLLALRDTSTILYRLYAAGGRLDRI